MITFQLISSEINDGNLSEYLTSTERKPLLNPENEEHYTPFHRPGWFQRGFDAKFTMSMFGSTDSGETVCLHVENFQTTILLRDDKKLGVGNIERIVESLRWILGKDCGSIEEEDIDEAKQDITLDYTPDMRKSNNGWRDYNDALYRITCRTLWSYNRCLSRLRAIATQNHVTVVESNCEPTFLFFVNHGFQTSGWYSFDPDKAIRSQQTYREHEYILDVKDLIPHADRHYFNRYTNVAAFDIESYSGNPDIFPLAYVPEYFTFSIALSHRCGDRVTDYEWYFSDPASEEGQQILSGELQPHIELEPNHHIYHFTTEASMLLHFAEFIGHTPLDVICGFNADGYDWPALYMRAKVNGIEQQFQRIISPIRSFRSFLVINELTAREYYRPVLPGIFLFDLLLDIMNHPTLKLEMNSLRNVSTAILNETKDDLSIAEMIQLRAAGTRDGAIRIRKYNARDTDITRRCVEKDNALERLVQSSNVTYTPLVMIHTRGSEIISDQGLYIWYRNDNYYYDKRHEVLPEGETAAGGAVQEPELIKTTSNQFVSTLDFTSLYPSIIQHYNIDYVTLLKTEYLSEETKNNLPLLDEYHQIHPNSGKDVTYRYVKGKKAPMPKFLEHVLSKRKEVKKSMKKISIHTAEYQTANALQQAYKLIANAMYGCLNAYRNPMVSTAETVTLLGRRLIAQVARWVDHDMADFLTNVEKMHLPHNFSSRVIYGDTDSVFILCENVSKEMAATICKKASVYITEMVINRPPINLDYEKTFDTHLQQKKKAYIYVQQDETSKQYYMGYKGGEFVKRTRCQYYKMVYRVLAETIMLKYPVPHRVDEYQNSICVSRNKGKTGVLKSTIPIDQKWCSMIQNGKYFPLGTTVPDLEQNLELVQVAMRYFDLACRDLVLGEVPIELLKSKTSIKRTYKGTDEKGNNIMIDNIYTYPRELLPKIAQVQLCRRMYDRNKGSQPANGSRFEYVFVDNGETEKSSKTETITYVMEHQIPVDYMQYLQTDFKDCTRLFKICAAGAQSEYILNKWVQIANTRKAPKVVRVKLSPKMLHAPAAKKRKHDNTEANNCAKITSFFTNGSKPTGHKIITANRSKQHTETNNTYTVSSIASHFSMQNSEKEKQNNDNDLSYVTFYDASMAPGRLFLTPIEQQAFKSKKKQISDAHSTHNVHTKNSTKKASGTLALTKEEQKMSMHISKQQEKSAISKFLNNRFGITNVT